MTETSQCNSTVLHSATIVTMDAERRVLDQSTLVLVADRIVWLGPDEDIPSIYRGGSRIDASGKAILPGLVNLHTHAALSILRGLGDDMGIAPAYSPGVPQGVFLSEHDCYILSLLGGAEALRFGTTCIVDNYIHEAQAARAFTELGLRAVVSERLHDADLFQIPNGVFSFDEARGMELLGKSIELIERWHGRAGGRILCRIGPHAPDTCSELLLGRARQTAEERGVGLVTHLAQSKRECIEIARRSGLTPTAFLGRAGLLGPQLIAGHCIFVDAEDIQLLARTGTHVSHQSGSNAKGGMMAPIRPMLQQGINVGLGTDNMAGDMVEVMRLAVCTARIRESDPVALRAQDVLAMATVGGARALGLETEIGSLEIGKKADLVVIDLRKLHLVPLIDPVANLVHNGLGSDVDMSFVDGRMLVEGGRLRTIDEGRLLREAQAVAQGCWSAMGGTPGQVLTGGKARGGY